jgi:ankyrin repeat protein
MGWTALMWSCYKNRLEAAKVLLENGAHINIVGGKFNNYHLYLYMICLEEDGLTPLIIASGRGYTEVVNALLCSGAEVNSSDKFGSFF